MKIQKNNTSPNEIDKIQILKEPLIRIDNLKTKYNNINNDYNNNSK